MTIQILSCQAAIGELCAFPFSGFITSSNKYGSATICDWDCCLYGEGTTGDSVYVDGYGTLSQPTPPADPNCITNANVQCSGAECHIDDDGNNVVDSTWDGRVDGHITYTALNDCYVKVTEATGSLSYQLDSILPMPDFSGVIGVVNSDQYCDANITNESCNNPDGSNIKIILGMPSPNNT